MQATNPSRLIVLLLSVITLSCWSWSAQAVATKTVFNQYKDRLVQIRIVDVATNAQATLGSGFFIDQHGTIITNYHVISKHVYKPEQYRIEFVMHDGEVHPATLLNIDVIHDLAILDGERILSPHLNLSTDVLSKGERIYTLGNPLDLGMTIVESTYNGITDDTMHERILLSGALNPGMSGGPSITEAGIVVGINVAATGNNIGFLVPVKFLKKLLATQGTAKIDNFIDVVRRQLLANQNDYINTILAKPMPNKKLGNYVVPDRIANYLDCWGDTDEANKPYRGSTTLCAVKNDIFLSTHHSTGELRYSHHYFSADHMNRFRFYNIMQQFFSNPGITLTGTKEDVTDFQCQTDFVQKKSLQMKVAFCLREFRNLRGLYDMVLTAATVTEDNQGIITTLVAGGISSDNAIAFAKSYMETLSWNPP